MAQRLKGQEVEVLIVVDGNPQTNITAIKSFDVTLEQDILDEGFLGETTNRKDSIYNGISGNIEFQTDDQGIFDILTKIVDKARRRTPGLKINIKATLNYPNGQRPKILVPDVEFGAMPFNVGSRSDYATIKLPFAASDYQVIK